MLYILSFEKGLALAKSSAIKLLNQISFWLLKNHLCKFSHSLAVLLGLHFFITAWNVICALLMEIFPPDTIFGCCKEIGYLLTNTVCT